MKLKFLLPTLAAILLIEAKGLAQSAIPPKPRDTSNAPQLFGFGRPATQKEILAWDIDVRPDGKGLPPGKGEVATGKALYLQKCLACHGSNDPAYANIRPTGPVLFSDTTAKSRPKAIGNYWPYATTLFDYIRRTMPYNSPATLTDNEVYAITAYLLNANKIIKQGEVLNAKTLPKITMPARKLFIIDDRKGGPEVK